MSTTFKNVAVLGASGNLGPYFLSALKEAGFNVIAVVRTSSKATFPADVEVRKSDYTFDSLVSIFKGQDALVSPIAASDLAVQKTIIDAAIAAGVKRILPSEFGGDTSLQGLAKHLPFASSKKDIFTYLKSKESQGISWTTVYTGIFLDWLGQALELGQGIIGFDLDNFKATRFDSGEERSDSTNIATVAKAVVAILQNADLTHNQQVYVHSHRLTQNQVIAAIERIAGKKLNISEASSLELAEQGRAEMARGELRSGSLNLVTAAIYAPWGFADFGGRSVAWNEALGLPEEDLDATIERVLKNKKII
ncbi:hypothetical protein PT974_02295 [Cladobotryum mycophilum]|uniref:NmrA-like domain-containing protein n=1 Tax=Cladobotryum mycophilum TaxID=491253 RepID=A0ABR0SYJ5_9HYPO